MISNMRHETDTSVCWTINISNRITFLSFGFGITDTDASNGWMIIKISKRLDRWMISELRGEKEWKERIDAKRSWVTVAIMSELRWR